MVVGEAEPLHLRAVRVEQGVHVRLYDRQEIEFTEASLRSVSSYQDVEDGLDYAVQRVTECWQENERRSDRGY